MVRTLPSIIWLTLCLLFVSCATSPRSAAEVSLGSASEVQLMDTLPELIATLGQGTLDTDDALRAWPRYEARFKALFAAVGALDTDPGDQQLFRLVAQPQTLVKMAESVQRDAPGELNALWTDLARTLGLEPKCRIALAVTREMRVAWRGTYANAPLVLFNAAHPALTAPASRQAAFARELLRVLHEAREPDTGSLSPLARQLWREGAATLAARKMVPRAQENEVLGVRETDLTKLRGRESLIAKELLASLESAREVEAARFFDAAVKDPVLPPSSGPFIADRLYQRLSAEMGSIERPLRLSAPEFLQRSRKHLVEMTSAR
jgi:hypothetical protein